MFCPLVLGEASAQTSPAPLTLDRAHINQILAGLNRGRSVGQVAVSPDGKRVAWIEGVRDGGDILVAPLNDFKNTQHISAAAQADQHCAENDMTWAPDAKSLAFFSDCGKPGEQADLYLSRLDGTPARRLTELRGYVNQPAFSPDGTKIAFLYVEGATRPAGALAAMKPPSGIIGEDGVEIQRVAVSAVDPASPEAPEQVTPANLHVYEFDWSPDSKGLAYVAGNPPGENNWWVAKLYTQSLGKAPKAIFAPADEPGPLHGMQIAVPRWSPDGKSIAFIGGLMSDQGSTGGDVWLVPAAGGAPRDLTQGRPTSPAWIEWDGADHLFVSELAGGNDQLIRLHLQGDRTGDGGQFWRAHFQHSRQRGRWEDGAEPFFDSGSCAVRVSGQHIRASDGDLRRQAGHGDDVGAGRRDAALALQRRRRARLGQGGFAELEERRVPRAGLADAAQGLRSGQEISVDCGSAWWTGGGGASRSWGGRGGLSANAFSALGYFVLLPNPRGSYGQGEAFTQANRKDFGYGDLRDILAGVDAVEAKYPVDPDRVGLTGWSYGGFMTMFAVTQTHRFRAAVAGAGISDWQSYYGENSIDQWMIPYFGASVYDDPAVYAKSSAISYIKQVKTPTLVVVGDRDGECPAPQSFEFWHALRDQHVPTQLVVYPNEGHGFVDPAHRRDVMDRAVEWFARYMPEPGTGD